jgi:hypothetical protein
MHTNQGGSRYPRSTQNCPYYLPFHFVHKIKCFFFDVFNETYCIIRSSISFLFTITKRAHNTLGSIILFSVYRSVAMLGVSSAEVLRAIVLIFVPLPILRLTVADFATVVACSTELAFSITSRVAIAITRPDFLGTLFCYMPHLLTVVTGPSKKQLTSFNQHHHLYVCLGFHLLVSTTD